MSEATVKGPQVRIRVNHTRTARDGWKLSETTVEVEGTIEQANGMHQLSGFNNPETPFLESLETIVTGLLGDVFSYGEVEAQRRNNADRQAVLNGPGDPDMMAEIPF